ncbi:MAG: UvrB/UvrC motif-containing protein [Planctomycetota bacterium]
MLCMVCKKNPATVQITDIRGGQKKQVNLCAECAKGQGVIIKAQDALAALLANIGQLAAKELEKGADLRCPSCGTSFADFRTRGRLGCPRDYEVFREMLEPLLMKIHGSLSHTGRSPAPKGREEGASGAMQRARQLTELREELKRAVAGEEYERAAELRDEIQKLEGRRDET